MSGQVTNNVHTILELEQQGQVIACEEACRRLLQLGHDRLAALDLLSRSLARQGRIVEAIDVCEQLLEISNEPARIMSRLVCYANYKSAVSRRSLQRLAHRFERTGDTSGRTEFRNTRDHNRQLVVGFVGTEFFDHSKFFFTHELFRRLDRNEFKVHAYSDSAVSDRCTKVLRAAVDRWCDITDVSDEGVSQTIREDGVDILVDVMGHVGRTRIRSLLAKPAPVMIEYLEAPSELSVFDYRITDEIADPSAEAALSATRPIRIEHGFHAYEPPHDAPEIRQHTGTIPNQVTFCCFATAHKLSREVMKAWSEILKALPAARLLLKNASFADRRFAKRTQFHFEQAGIARNRIQCLASSPSRRIHLSFYNLSDIALDTFPIAGVTTTCEALWMGTPLVSLSGRNHMERRGASILTSAGLGEFVAQNPDDYVAIAIAAARNVEEIRQRKNLVRSELRRSALCDSERLAKSLQRHFREIWRSWCERKQQNKLAG